jgi:hypothetical protein
MRTKIALGATAIASVGIMAFSLAGPASATYGTDDTLAMAATNTAASDNIAAPQLVRVNSADFNCYFHFGHVTLCDTTITVYAHHNLYVDGPVYTWTDHYKSSSTIQSVNVCARGEHVPFVCARNMSRLSTGYRLIGRNPSNHDVTATVFVEATFRDNHGYVSGTVFTARP